MQERFSTDKKIVYLGKAYKLQVGNYAAITLEQDALLFPQALLFRIQKEISEWYIKQARMFITQLVENYASQMQTSYNAISFSDTSSKWGSCTHDNRLQFNWRLIMAPLLVVRYVIVHELAHTIHKNHSASFWSKVRLYNPSFNQQRKWLHDHGHLLVV